MGTQLWTDQSIADFHHKMQAQLWPGDDPQKGLAQGLEPAGDSPSPANQVGSI